MTRGARYCWWLPSGSILTNDEIARVLDSTRNAFTTQV